MTVSLTLNQKHTPHFGEGSQSSRWSYLETESWQLDFCLEKEFPLPHSSKAKAKKKKMWVGESGRQRNREQRVEGTAVMTQYRWLSLWVQHDVVANPCPFSAFRPHLRLDLTQIFELTHRCALAGTTLPEWPCNNTNTVVLSAIWHDTLTGAYFE